MSAPSLLVVIPCYRRADLIPSLVESLRACRADLIDTGARLLFVNDSPDDDALAEALAQAAAHLTAIVPTDICVNDRNLGFVGACNRAFEYALALGADVLLLNSDTIPMPGAMTEIAAVAAWDPGIGLVSPRSNNAAICNSPRPDRFRSLAPEDAWTAHRSIQAILPRLTPVPTPVGFCLYLKAAMLRTTGLFDPIYGAGYNEENDLAQRASHRGFRSVLANHAFVYHMGSASFSIAAEGSRALEIRNHALLINRYPDYPARMADYHADAGYRAEYLLGGLAGSPGLRSRLLLDLRHGPVDDAAVTRMLARARACMRLGDTHDLVFACGWDSPLRPLLKDLPWLADSCDDEVELAPLAAVIRLGEGAHRTASPPLLAPVDFAPPGQGASFPLPAESGRIADDVRAILDNIADHISFAELKAKVAAFALSTQPSPAPSTAPPRKPFLLRIRRWLAVAGMRSRGEARLSLDTPVPKAIRGRLRRLDATIPPGPASQDVMTGRLLDWASLLHIGGYLHLRVARRSALFGPLSPFTPEGLPLWLHNAGLKVEAMHEDGNDVIAVAVKLTDWAAALPNPPDAADFLQQSFAAILHRPLDRAGQRHYLQAMGNGVDRRTIARNILSSRERGAVLQRSIGTDASHP